MSSEYPKNLPEGVDGRAYWCIRPKGVSWYFLMQELLRQVDLEKHAKDQPALFLLLNDGSPFYMFKKTYYPIENIMKVTGLPQDVVEKTKVLRLVETDKEGIPLPTVEYWGRA